jgi:damage-control phosphatase, subfamily I
MRTPLECFPCFLRQTLQAVRRISSDKLCHEHLLREVCHEAASFDLALSPPAMGQRVHRLIRELTGNPDPYREVKRRFNEHALRLYPRLREQIGASPDPFEMAVRLSIAGNRIDFGVAGDTTEAEVEELLRHAATCVVRGSIDALRQAVAKSQRILYLADNAGEIVFDRLLIEQLPLDKVVVAVRGGPVINDVTREDAIAAGLADIVEVLENGSNAPGTILDDCSPAFQRYYASADLVIAKGQGNYETLDDVRGKCIFFLLMVKCPVVAGAMGHPEGSFVVYRSPDLSITEHVA